MTAHSLLRARWLPLAMLLTLGLISVQALIGGRRLVFLFPGLCLIAATALIAVAVALRSGTKSKADVFCLSATTFFFSYLLIRALASPVYFARADLFSALGALVVYGVTATVLTSSGARWTICIGLMVFALVHIFVGIIQFTRGDNFMLIPSLARVDYGQRASGFYVCPNHLAGLLEVVGVFGLSLICWSRWPVWAKLLVGYATVACYVGLALTGSRGGYVSAVGSLMVFGGLSLVVLRITRPRQWIRFGMIGLAGFVVILLTAGYLIRQHDFLHQRAGNIIDTNNMRFQLWEAALKQWKLQPLVGTGSGSYRFYGRQFRSPQMQNDPIDVHNDYLHLLCEYGLIGAAGFLVFFGSHLRKGWQTLEHIAGAATVRAGARSDRLALQLGALSAISAYVIHSALDFNLHIPANALLLAFVFGILAGCRISRNAAMPRPSQASIPLRVTAALAIILIIQSARLFPGEYYAEKARVALRDGEPTKSIEFVQKALAYEKQNPHVFFYLGRALIASTRLSDEELPDAAVYYDRALAALQRAQSLAPLDVTYPLDLAFTLDEMGRFSEAEQMYDVARSRDPNSMAVAQLYRAHLEARASANATPDKSL